MKILIYTLSFLFANSLIAQTHKISNHNGEQLDVNLVKLEKGLVVYCFDGSLEEHKINQLAIAEIKNIKTNQIQKVSDKIVINSKSDYQLVQILEDDKTIGLKLITSFSGVSTKTKGESPIDLKKQTLMRIKMKSASMGYPFVNVQEKADGKYEAFAYDY